MPINTDPIFTNIGINKIANAILTNTHIQLTTIKVGDCINDLNYQHTPLDTDIQHFIADTQVESIHYLDLQDSNHAVLRIRGFIPFNLAADYTIREYGVYDSNNDLIIVGRITDTELKTATSMKTEFELVVNISISDAQKAFLVNNVPDSEYVSKNDLTAHIEAINPHGLTKEQLGFNNVTNTSDLDKPTHPYIAKLFHDTKLGVGFANRVDSVISKSGNNIILTPINPTVVYSRGVKHTIYNPISVDTSVRQNGNQGETYPNGYLGGFYVAYSPINNSLFIIAGNPDFDNDILVAWFYRNRTQGIIWLGDERHAASRNTDHHRLHHLEVGAAWLEGGLLLATLLDDSNNKLSITSPIRIADEDLNHTIIDVATPMNPYEQKLTNAKLSVLYIDNNGEYRSSNNNNENLNWLYNGAGAVYNNVATGALVAVPSGKYLSYWMLFTNDQVEPVKLVVGRMAHDTIDAAGAEVLEGFGLPMPEIIGAYKIILHIDSSYNNLAKARIQSVFEISNNTSKSSIKANSHTLLLGRNEEGQHTVNSIRGLSQALADAGKVKKVGLTGTVKADTTEVDNNGKITLDTYMSDSRNMVYRDDPVFVSTFGSIIPPQNQVYYEGSALAYNGRMYAPPYANIRQTMEIDTITKTTSFIGATYPSGNWISITLASNGMLYCPPFGSGKILKIDPIAKTTTLLSIDTGASRWFTSCLAPNGKIYCPPRLNSSGILVIDPSNDTASIIPMPSSEDYNASVLAPNGKIYCIPNSMPGQILEIDPASNTFKKVGRILNAGESLPRAFLYVDGNMYSYPFSSEGKLFKFEPNNYNISTLDIFLEPGLEYGGSFGNSCLAPNGRLYCPPYRDKYVRELNMDTLSIKRVGEISAVSFNTPLYYDLVLASNGKLYSPPRSGGVGTLEVDPFPKSTDFQAYLKLPSQS